MIQKRLIIKGSVQVVDDDIDYREKVKFIAIDMDIPGYVRNIQDGTVEILCECKDKKQLSKFKEKITIKEQGRLKPYVEKIDEYSTEGLHLGSFRVWYEDKDLEILKATTRWVNSMISFNESIKKMNVTFKKSNDEMKSINNNIVEEDIKKEER